MFKTTTAFLLLVLTAATILTSCSKVDHSYVEIRYAVTNEMTKNLVVMMDSNSWKQGILRLKLIPKTDPVKIESMVIQFEDQPLTTFGDLKGSLDLLGRKEQVIQLNEPFPAGKLDLAKLSISTLNGSTKK